jgi:hypothetical protein
MKISVEVSDFGEVVVSSSLDNPECVRLELKEQYGDDTQHFDLDRDELDEVITMLCLIRGQRKVD